MVLNAQEDGHCCRVIGEVGRSGAKRCSHSIVWRPEGADGMADTRAVADKP
jgi:hypothetical protein